MSSVRDAQGMFYRAFAFNQPIGDWNMSSVTSTYYMFNGATAFNQSIGDWDMSSVTNTAYLFSDAAAFNQNLCSWGDKLSPSADVQNMFLGASSCHSQSSPDLTASPPGPFCYDCSN